MAPLSAVTTTEPRTDPAYAFTITRIVSSVSAVMVASTPARSTRTTSAACPRSRSPEITTRVPSWPIDGSTMVIALASLYVKPDETAMIAPLSATITTSPTKSPDALKVPSKLLATTLTSALSELITSASTPANDTVAIDAPPPRRSVPEITIFVPSWPCAGVMLSTANAGTYVQASAESTHAPESASTKTSPTSISPLS